MVAPSDPIHLLGPPDRFVSRAGAKLDGALEAFGIDVTDMSAIDVGASTGGFTDCLLQRGARRVVALDVGYGQLHWKVRSDERVSVVERTNIRSADPTALGAPFDLIVGDLSFISLRLVAGHLAALGGPDSRWVMLIKPQFEAGKEEVGRGGIVPPGPVHLTVLNDVIAAFETHGLGCQGLVVSSVRGATGNVEYVAHFEHRATRIGLEEVDGAVAAATDQTVPDDPTIEEQP